MPIRSGRADAALGLYLSLPTQADEAKQEAFTADYEALMATIEDAVQGPETPTSIHCWWGRNFEPRKFVQDIASGEGCGVSEYACGTSVA